MQDHLGGTSEELKSATISVKVSVCVSVCMLTFVDLIIKVGVIKMTEEQQCHFW